MELHFVKNVGKIGGIVVIKILFILIGISLFIALLIFDYKFYKRWYKNISKSLE